MIGKVNRVVRRSGKETFGEALKEVNLVGENVPEKRKSEYEALLAQGPARRAELARGGFQELKSRGNGAERGLCGPLQDLNTHSCEMGALAGF